MGKSKKNNKMQKFRRRSILIGIGLAVLLLCKFSQEIGGIHRIAYNVSNTLNHAVAGRGGSTKASNLFSVRDGYPASLIELAENNPETVEFVRNYPKKKDKQGEIDVSGDLTAGIPFFLQWDERWGYQNYGGDFMALNGCGPTCLSMVWCGLTGKSKWNPYKVAKMAEERGYYVKGAGTSWELMTKGAEALGLYAENLSLNETVIMDRLQQGNPIICVVGPGDFTTQGHFLVLTGVNEEGEIILHDPNSRKRSEGTWDLDNLMSQMRNLWAYSL